MAYQKFLVVLTCTFQWNINEEVLRILFRGNLMQCQILLVFDWVMYGIVDGESDNYYHLCSANAKQKVDNFFVLTDLRSRLSGKKGGERKATQNEELNKKRSPKRETKKFAREQELDVRIQQIKQRNEVILKRAKEVQAEKKKFSS